LKNRAWDPTYHHRFDSQADPARHAHQPLRLDGGGREDTISLSGGPELELVTVAGRKWLGGE